MRIPALVAVLALAATLAGPAAAQKPPPLDGPTPTLGIPWDGIPGVPPGKPPPLGVPWNGPSRAGGRADGGPLPPAGDHKSGSGSGFVVADQRLLTNRHVIAECERVVALDAQGGQLPAHVVATDRIRDLALLSVDKPAGPPLVFRDSPPVRRGEYVVAYGFPLSGLLSSGPTLTVGNISALAGLRDDPANFQISAAVQPGSSGGPLFDVQGHVVGVVVSKLNATRVAQMTGGDIPQNVNFAVKGSEALAFLRANGVKPMVAPSTGPDRRPDEVDAVANPSTVALQCFR